MAEQDIKQFSEEIKRYFDEKSEESKRHFDVVAEDISSKLESVAELASDIPDIKEMVVKNTEDIEVMKTDIEIIKQGLRRKVDVEDFAVLEKRVTALESKLQR